MKINCTDRREQANRDSREKNRPQTKEETVDRNLKDEMSSKWPTVMPSLASLSCNILCPVDDGEAQGQTAHIIS